jgi:hypothetical protein
MGSRCALIFALAGSFALGACTGKDPYNPGEPVGTFKVTAKLLSNSCAESPDPWQFDVRLNRDPGKLYWMQGGLPVEGTVDAASNVKLESSDARVVRKADAKRGLAQCQMWRDDQFTGKLGPEPLATFTGKLTYTFRPGDGSDCSDQLKTGGGGWEKLPCQMTYEVSAVKTADPPKKK